MKYSKNKFSSIQIVSKPCVFFCLYAIAMVTFPMLSHASFLAGDEIYISFDNTSDDFTDGEGKRWNRLAFSSSVGEIDGDLQNTGNVLTGVGINLVDRLTANSAPGDTSGSTWPSAAVQDYWYGDDGTHNGGSTGNNLGEFTITGLNQSLTYNFDLFGSRGGVNGTRETEYTVTGTNSGSGTIDVVNNTSNSVFITHITPDGSGNITLSLKSGSTNDSSSKYFYINAMKITAIPEPASFVLLLGGLGLIVTFRRFK